MDRHDERSGNLLDGECRQIMLPQLSSAESDVECQEKLSVKQPCATTNGSRLGETVKGRNG